MIEKLMFFKFSNFINIFAKFEKNIFFPYLNKCGKI